VDLARQLHADAIVRGLRVFSDFELEFRMALTNKRLAPDVEVVCLITAEEHTFLSSSTVKEVASLGGDVSGMVPPHVAQALQLRFSELDEDGHNSVPVVSLRD
jgi:pantetheine-phosphate adenylyltransferase